MSPNLVEVCTFSRDLTEVLLDSCKNLEEIKSRKTTLSSSFFNLIFSSFLHHTV